MTFPYTKIKELGRGSFGACFVVKGVDGNQHVLKEVSLRGLCQKEQRRSVAEVKILRKLNHPHIIGYCDSCLLRNSATLCIVMELADGGDLGMRIKACLAKRQRFSEKTILRVAAQAVSALAYCHHKLFLLHRDIKPANIFLTHGGDVKIGDFGLSKSLAASHGLANTKCGSPVYMSPELASGRAYDRGCDVWALGMTLVEMASLQTPWVDQHQPRTGIMGLMRLVSHGSLDLAPLRAHYSADAIEVLATMLAKPAASRPSFRHLSQHPLLRPHIVEEACLAAAPPRQAPCAGPNDGAKVAFGPAVIMPATAALTDGKSNPFTLGGPLSRVVTPSLTPRTAPSGPTGAGDGMKQEVTGAVPIPRPPPFQRGAEWARAEEAPAEVSGRAHGTEAHAAALAIQRSIRLARFQGKTKASPRSVIPTGQPTDAPWEDKYAQLIAKRKQALRQAQIGGKNIEGFEQFQERMAQQQKRWAIAQGQ